MNQVLATANDTIYTRQDISERIHQRHAQDCRLAKSLLASEENAESFCIDDDDDSSSSSSSSAAVVVVDNASHDDDDDDEYRDIRTVSDNYLLAIQSTPQQQPLFNDTTIQIIRRAAELKWQTVPNNNTNSNSNNDDGTTTRSSRFTYQSRGNYEAHVTDLGNEVIHLVNHVLVHQVYPMVRKKFWHDKKQQQQQPYSRLCVYDALYIRYNATEALLLQEEEEEEDGNKNAVVKGAGQPLHRDLGIISVNVMLNNATEFTGGGTFFENQLRDSDNNNKTQLAAVKPVGAGHVVAHVSSERHAGAATTSGVRDIMVLFVTAEAHPAPAVIQAAMLKQTRDVCVCQDDDDNNNNSVERVLYCRLLHQTMACQANPEDGEAWQYLANALIDYADLLFSTSADTNKNSNVEASLRALECAQQALEEAVTLIPCDARVYNTMARTLDRIRLRGNKPWLLAKVAQAYKRGIDLLEQAQRMGCQTQELDSMRLNYGLHLANQDRFAEASVVLETVTQRYEPSHTKSRIVADAYRLYQMCERQK